MIYTSVSYVWVIFYGPVLITRDTETAKVTNNILMLFDLSAAFDAIDHPILLDRLPNWVGFSGTTPN